MYDWIIAKEDIQEEIDESIYIMAENLLKEVLEFVNNNELREITQNNLRLFQLIGRAGYITNLYGTGRPESGSEHILAKAIEHKINIPHGISVSIGIIIMSIIQEHDSDDVIKAIMKLKIFDKGKKYGLNFKLIEECLYNLKPRKDRYSIINRINNKNSISNAFEKFKNIINEMETMKIIQNKKY